MKKKNNLKENKNQKKDKVSKMKFYCRFGNPDQISKGDK